MALNFTDRLPPEESRYLKELAQQYIEYANLPVMRERENLWSRHNSLNGDRPPVVMEVESFLDDLLPKTRCSHPGAAEMERYFQTGLCNHELVDDDKVLSQSFDIPYSITTDTFGVDIGIEYSADSQGRNVGFAYEHPIKELSTDLGRLRPSRFTVNRSETEHRRQIAEDTIGDILPVHTVNKSLDWYVAPSMQVVELMGMETMMFEMLDHPEKIHELYSFLVTDIKSFLRWQERENLLCPNNGNNYAGAGSYGFTDELDSSPEGGVTTRDLWGNMNSQETVGISPQMFGEFIYPYYKELAEEFGLVYFGCCEPVHDIWEACISHLPNLRKVSISAWCDEEFMGDALRNSSVIYSRKPSPNFIGLGGLDEDAFKQHIAYTLRCAKGCSTEILFRDIYSLDGDRSKPGRAVGIVRELIDKHC